MQLRKATGDDAASIARVHYESWHQAFDDLLASSYCHQQTLEYLEQFWDQYFLNKQVDQDVLVGTHDNKIIGFVAVGPVQETTQFQDEHSAEIDKIYVLPQEARKGYGAQLLQAALDDLEKKQYSRALVRVFNLNMPAQKFYEREGAVVLGHEPFQDYHGELLATVYKFDL